MQKKYYLALSVLAVASFAGGVLADSIVQPFTDVAQNHWAFGAVNWAAQKGFMKGTEPGHFNPDGTLTRAQYAVASQRMYLDLDARLKVIEKIEGITVPQMQELSSSSEAYYPVQMGDSRDAQRRVDVNVLMNAVYQWQIDNNGKIPAGLTGTETEVCRGKAVGCKGLNLDFLIGPYLVNIPVDPSLSATSLTTGYAISLDSATKRMTVKALKPETGTSIEITR